MIRLLDHQLFLVVLLSHLAVTASLATTSGTWKPKISSLDERRRLRGIKHESETIGSIGFHHIEFYCGDAKSMASRFALALGMRITGESGQMTGNDQCISYGLESGEFRVIMTAPYSRAMAGAGSSTKDDMATAPDCLPSFSVDSAHEFFRKHGLAAKAIGLSVKNARASFEAAVNKGARPVLEPRFVPTCRGQKNAGVSIKGCTMAEVELYGDVVLRFISYDAKVDDNAPFLPNLAPHTGKGSTRETYGIHRIDHAVGNVPNLLNALNYVQGFTGFHEFAEFTADDVGTVESGLNSVVLASDTEDVLLPLNEPTQGRRKSQIQTYLEQNEGAGLQHLALKTHDIFETIRKMKEADENYAGFELMKRPSDQYYRELPDRLGDQLSVREKVCIEHMCIRVVLLKKIFYSQNSTII
jgi:4-hydroxyphenylpyruvate dioxygenase